MSRTMLAAFSACLLAFGGAAAAQTAPKTDAAPAPVSFADKASWLCWPGRADACASDNTTTIVAASGALARESWAADPKAPVDCFYVYPTVSLDPGVLSDMTPNAEERRVVEQQLSRFASKCRVYAPMYRQFTLTALRSAIVGGAGANVPRPDTPYQDVVDAWTYYLKNENHGRGVVLIGHSQGSGVLTRLIASEIDGKPAQQLLISAMLTGSNLPIEPGKDVGAFKSIPTCKSADQTGCAIAYVSFRDTIPPPANTRFGRPREPGSTMKVACVNPAELLGRTELHSYLAAAGNGMDPAGWSKGAAAITTPFVSTPGLLSGRCVDKNGFQYLEVHINADPADPRTDTLKGDVMIGPDKISEDWGLHLIDVNLVMGDLVEVVDRQSKAWAKGH